MVASVMRSRLWLNDVSTLTAECLWANCWRFLGVAILHFVSAFHRAFDLASWPLVAYLGAYAATAVVGATVILTPFGRAQAQIFLPGFVPDNISTLGSPLYWVLLFAPLLVVPVFAFAGIRAGTAAVHWLPHRIDDPSTRMLSGLAAVLVAWCLFKLIQTGNVIPEAMLDRSKNCFDRIAKRAELFTALRYLFYAVAYSALPVVSVLFFVRAGRDRRRVDIVGFGLTFVALFYLYSSIYLKAPFLTYAIMLLCAAVVMRWWMGAGIVVAGAVMAFVAASFAIRCEGSSVVTLPAAAVTLPVTLAHADTPVTPDAPPLDEAPAKPNIIIAETLPLVRNLAFRMAMSYPYYVEIFSDPAERCGIEDNRVPFIPKQTCFPAAKAFTVMYPKMKHATQGNAPAPAHVSALAELGPWYAFAVIAISGLLIGAVSAAAILFGPMVRPAAIAAVTMFAYNLTQVPLVGALTYSQGLVPLALPLVFLAVVQCLCALWKNATERLKPSFVLSERVMGRLRHGRQERERHSEWLDRQ